MDISHLKLFVLPSCEYLLQDSPPWGKEKEEFILKTFPSGELQVILKALLPANTHAVILGSIAPPAENLITFLMLAHTLKKEGAAKITAVLPYLGYSRHDKKEPLKSHAIALIGNLFRAAHIDELMTIDVHSAKTEALMGIPVISLSPANLFATELKRNMGNQAFTFLAPDEGAIARCQQVADMAGVKEKVAYLVKKRTEQGITHQALHGEIGERVLIVDDILDTGKTLVSCCQFLHQQGVKEIEVMITHGLFSDHAWEALLESGVTKLYCTNSIPLRKELRSPKIQVISIEPLLQACLTEHR